MSAPSAQEHANPFSIEAFEDRIEAEFIDGSAISVSMYCAAVRIHASLELDPSGEAVTPLHDALNWRYTRFGRHSAPDFYGAIILNEDESPWQVKLDTPRTGSDGKQHKYEAVKGNGSRAFLPFVPADIRQLISDRYGADVPMDGSFWEWLELHPEIPIVWTEGAKKSMALLSQGYVAIALYGVNSGYGRLSQTAGKCKAQLIADVSRFAGKGRSAFIAFDKDEVAKTVRRVNIAKFQFGRLLKAAGCEVKLVHWAEPFKGVDDLIVGAGAEAFDFAYNQSIGFQLWASGSHSKLTYEPTLELNERYLPRSLQIPPTARIAGLRSPKGSGKTEVLDPNVDAALQRGQRVLFLSHRIQLCQALCNRVGIRSIYEVVEAKGDERESRKAEARNFGMGLVVDSMHPESQAKFNADDWAGAVVIIDECEQVFWHLLNSATCKDHRVAILQQFARLMEVAGQVILADADLSDVSIDLVKKLSGFDGDPWICLNKWKPQPLDIISYESQQEWLQSLESAIEMGDRVFVCLDSQQMKSKYSTQSLERHFARKFPSKKILRIDSKSLGTKDHPACGCIGRINDVVSEYDVVICSPSVETGVSIDIRGHFNSVWAAFYGVNSADSARQALMRVREGVPRHVWAQERGLGSIGRGETSIDAICKSEAQLVRSALHLISDAADDGFEVDGDMLNAYKDCWAKMAVRINTAMPEFRKSLVAALREEGHEVRSLLTISEVEEKAVKQSMGDSRNAAIVAHSKVLERTALIDDDEAKLLEDAKTKTLEEQNQLERYSLDRRYGLSELPETESEAVRVSEVHLKDAFGWYAKIQLAYFLTEGREFLKGRDRSKRDELAKDGMLWGVDLRRSTLSVKVEVLEIMGIPALLEPGREFRNTDEDLIALQQRTFESAASIKVALGFTVKQGDSPEEAERKIARGEKPIKPATPIEVLAKFVDLLGYRIRSRKEGGKGNQTRVYRLATAAESYADHLSKPSNSARLPQEFFGIGDGRDLVFSAWTQRFKEAIARKEEKAAATVQPQPETTEQQASQLQDLKMYQDDTVSTKPVYSYIEEIGGYQNGGYQDLGIPETSSTPLEKRERVRVCRWGQMVDAEILEPPSSPGGRYRVRVFPAGCTPSEMFAWNVFPTESELAIAP